MIVYRLQKEKFGTALSGAGAAQYGGRWNPVGVELVYTSSGKALALAELLAHLPAGLMPPAYLMLEIFIPDSTSMKVRQKTDLSPDWNVFPPLIPTQRIGDEFTRENKYCLLKVPSAVVDGDFNLLINPMHPEFAAIRVIAAVPFPFDRRLLRLTPP